MHRLPARDLADPDHRDVITEWLGRRSEPARLDRSVAVESIGPGVTKPLHFHLQSEELFLVLKGSGAIEIDGMQHPLVAPDAILVLPNERHSLVTGPDDGMLVVLISTPAYEPEDFVLC
jgi:quercetin dioxygenase-like cupin family protein